MTKKERNAARGQDCTLRISGYQSCADTDTTVLAHAPCRDDGKGFKSPDRWAAFACSKCHDIIDGRAGIKVRISNEEKLEAWLRGIYETQKILNVFGEMKS